MFASDEVETIISDARIPADRQMVYALELLAGVRPGEAAALRWRHYDPTVTPLGKILVAKSYNTRGNIERATKPTRSSTFLFIPCWPRCWRVAAQCVNTLTPKWSTKLAGFDVYVWDQCYAMEQSLRIE